MHNYTGNPSIVLVDPPVFSEISDGDNLDEAHLNPPVEQEADYIANYVHYGAKLNSAGSQAFLGPVVFAAKVQFESNTQIPQTPFTLANSSDQTINPNTQQTNYYRGILRGSTSVVRLDTVGVFDGDWLEIVYTMAVGVDLWQFRRGADNTANICTLDNSVVQEVAGASVLGGNTLIDGAHVKFMRFGGLWHLASIGIAVKAGTYA